MQTTADGISLTEVECSLVNAVQTGNVFDLSDEDDNSIRASVIRDILRGKLAGDADPRGIRIREAVITGDLDLTDLHTSIPLALASCTLRMPIRLDRSHLSSLDLTGCELDCLSGWYLHCEHDLNLTGLRCPGGIEIPHARVGGQLGLSDAELGCGSGPALNLDGAQIAGTVFLDEDFSVKSSSTLGAVRLVGVTIGGQLDLSGARIINDAGPALYADGARIEGSAFIKKCTVTARSELGAVSLIEGHIKGELNFGGATLENIEGPALNADGININGTAFLDDGFTITGQGSRGVLRLPYARIGGQLSLDGISPRNTNGKLAVDLGGARVEDEFILDVGRIVEDMNFCIELDGLRYPAVPRKAHRPQLSPEALRAPVEKWLKLLGERTPRYAAHPYQQLAAVLRAEGHERDARRVLIAQQIDLRVRGQIGSTFAEAWHRISGWTIGYGYRSSRALLGLLLTMLVALILIFSAGSAHLTTGATADRLPTACSAVQEVILAADTAIPLVKTVEPSTCNFDQSSVGGQWFVFGGWLAQLVGWAFATLFVAGFTGLVRKST